MNLNKIMINEKPNEENQLKSLFEQNDSIIKEKLLLEHPLPISLKQTEIIIDQLKNTICNIYLGSGGRGTGFFLKINVHNNDKLLPVLLTCNHVIDKSYLYKKDIINIQINGEMKTIELKNRIIYTDKELDVTIIEIKEKKDGIKDFLLLDEDNQDIRISGETIYILQYFDSKEPSVAYGILKDLDKSKFTHFCNTNFGSSGSPILNLSNNKVIGIHIGTNTNGNYNVGTFLNNPINDFIKKKYKNIIEENEIKSLMNQQIKKVYIEDIGININNDYNDSESTIFNFSSENKLNSVNIVKEGKFMDNYDIFYLYNILINIRILVLTYNNISDINFLEKVKFDKIEILYLDNNNISDINILEKVKFKGLKELYLNGNNISNIDILEKVDFPNLEKLDLSVNKIENIDVFEKVNFIKLKMLALYQNNISNINKIKLARFENLQLLTISHNAIKDISSLKYFKFKNLEYLFLADINLEKIDIFDTIKFKNLKILTFGGNNISNIRVLSKVDFKELEDLILYDNYISNIEVLAEVKFPKLKLLNLASNLITNIEVFENVNFPELNELNLQQNNIVDINVFKKCKFKRLLKLNIKINKIDIIKNSEIINDLKSNLNLFY